MSRVTGSLKRLLNSLPGGLAVCRTTDALWWHGGPHFSLGDQRYRSFCHAYNCGWPTTRMTERAVEIAIADLWLEAGGNAPVIELGAVTPYYWPGRVPVVVDPADEHRRVSHRQSLFEIDFGGSDVLSISTLEHIGLGDYVAIVQGETPRSAFEKIRRESRRYLITMPFGINPSVDSDFFRDNIPGARYLVRGPEDNWWVEVGRAADARRPYGTQGSHSTDAWANGLVILQRE